MDSGGRQKHAKRERTICGVIHEAAEAAQERRGNRTKPQPWIVRKLVVGFTVGIMGYAAYVYIRQLCLPMIWRREGAPASRGTGIALLAVFCVLYFWMVWAYFMVVITGPGYARDHVQKSERPLIPSLAPFRESFQSTELSHPDVIAPPSPPLQDVELGNRQSSQRNRSFSAATSRSQARSLSSAVQKRENGLAGPSYEDLLKRDAAQESNAGILDSISPPKPALLSNSKSLSSTSPVLNSFATVTSHQPEEGSSNSLNPPIKPEPLRSSTRALNSTPSAQRKKEMEEIERLEALNVTRKPPTTPVLQPVHRYCIRDGIVKPYRSHHCRICGTCILRYDHHCPWIGQCVGARNYKFFLNFCQAAAVFTSYTFGTLIAYTVVASKSSISNIDAQQIIIIALSGLFFIFTAALVISHTHLILSGQTTVESLHIRHMKDREDRALAKAFNWWQISAKQRTKKKWDQEWGRLDKEGNIWWRGNARDEWVDVMGSSWIGWILPTLRNGGSNGLEYPVNPRFDFEGRWRKRSEWPAALR
ncbi:Palmitoyltransferase PFA3 [Psilocybe cubensis]|uniref:Palmitoyltransferase PFA3 n=2 Tax=Psilocybe cubensis TaxID=181762 RepID=A0ACB8GN06_PSICU|nr:Palmitoyltransferase PFA3 [Psilocybe cubensis]KAH9477093.1 Palmitoyltransferase PFA3 [Psilocybe cubensis]